MTLFSYKQVILTHNQIQIYSYKVNESRDQSNDLQDMLEVIRNGLAVRHYIPYKLIGKIEMHRHDSKSKNVSVLVSVWLKSCLVVVGE